MDGESCTFVAVAFDATQITSKANRSQPKAGDACHPLAAGARAPAIAFSCKDHGADAGNDVAPILRSMGHDGSHANGGGQVAVAIQDVREVDKAQNGKGYNEDGSAYTLDSHATQGVAVGFQPRIARNGRGNMGDAVNALQAQSGQSGKGDAAPCVAITFQPGNIARGAGSNPSSEVVGTLRADEGRGFSDQSPHVATMTQVRRLTPKECSRLQGFRDGYLDIPFRGKPASDGPKYRALGNSMACNVMRWLAQRIEMVDTLTAAK